MKHFWQVTVHESMVFSLSMEDKGTFGLTDPQVLQNRAIPLKSGEIHNLMLPLLMPRCSGDPTLSTALFLILCCPTSEALLCCFLNRKCSCLNPTFLLPEEIKKILNYMQNTLICLKFMPVPCYQQQCKVCGKEKALVEKWATFILISWVSQHLSNRLLITLFSHVSTDLFKLPQTRFVSWFLSQVPRKKPAVWWVSQELWLSSTWILNTLICSLWCQ